MLNDLQDVWLGSMVKQRLCCLDICIYWQISGQERVGTVKYG